MNASESVYRGREGSGEAQIFQGNAGLAQLLRNQQYRQQQAMYQQRLGYQMQQQRNQRDKTLLSTDFGEKNPGAFQREQTVKEANAVRNKYIKTYNSNPYTSGTEIESHIENSGGEGSKAYSNVRKAKRAEVQKSLDTYQKTITKDPDRYDQQALSLIHDKLFSNIDQSTGQVSDKDIDEIDPNTVGNAAYHPSATNAHVAIVDAISPIKKQAQFSKPGEVINTGLGLMKIDEQGDARFIKEDGTPGVSGQTVQGVLDRDPAIENKFFWEIAQDNVHAAGGNANNLDSVEEVYKKIRHTDDPSILRQVFEKTKKDIEQFQQTSSSTKYTNFGKFSETQKAAPTEDDYKITRDQVNSVTNAFDKGDVTNVRDLLRNMGGKKWNGMYIMDAEPAIETDSKGPDKRKIKLTLKVGTAGGYAFKKDANGNVLTDPQNNLPLIDYNTPTKANSTETIYLDPKNKSALFDLFKYNHPEKKAKQMGYNGSGLSEAPVDEAEQFNLK